MEELDTMIKMLDLHMESLEEEGTATVEMKEYLAEGIAYLCQAQVFLCLMEEAEREV